MAFTPQFLDELRNRVAIADLIGRRVRLQRRGREHVGLCPFHNEKTPSFTVSDDKGFFHCFGCGAHGDAVGFVMRSEGLSFPEAVEKLAGEAGLAIPASSPEERQRAQREATLHGVLEAAAAWFEAQLASAAGQAALAYLQGRGLEERATSRFRLGYAPDSRGALKSALGRAGFADDLMVEAGLLVKPEEGGPAYDRFRGRVIFPISDRRGRVIAFGGRILAEGEPKYLNSPETPLFHKGRTLYGLAQAQKPAREHGAVIVAEGYMDVIALSQAGFEHAVAPLGTALTEEQILELWRLAPEPVLCFDGDAAGQRAAARAAERALPLLQPGRSLRFALLPAGEDPDTLIRRQGPGAMEAVVQHAGPLADRVWEMETVGRAFDTPERRAGLRRRLEERVGRIADRTVARDYRIEMEKRLDAAFGRTWGRHRPGRARPGLGGGQAARMGAPAGDRQREALILAVILNHPELLAGHGEELARLALADADLDKLRGAIIDLAASHPDLDSATLRNQLTEMGWAAALDAVLAAARIHGFANAAASSEEAGKGMVHLLGLMREQDVRREAETAARRLAEDMTGETLARFEAKQRLVQQAESRRRDMDPPEGPNFKRNP